MNVRQFYNKNQFIITNEKTKNNFEYYFQSYDSLVAKIDDNGVLYFGNDWDYSQTTLKHLYLFLNDYKNNITNKKLQYTKIFLSGFNSSTNKRQFLQNLINKKIIHVQNNL